jgi:NAD+ diphosphatase
MLITRGEECLLARHAKSRGNWYSTLAGFIEPGESVENALHREVAEEVGIQVHNLRFFTSQPWPFPGQLMLGFHADYLSGDIIVDGQEIEDARWWHWGDLPPVPPPGTLSGKLIQHFVDQIKGISKN